jgi:hypothetical protein
MATGATMFHSLNGAAKLWFFLGLWMTIFTTEALVAAPVLMRVKLTGFYDFA